MKNKIRYIVGGIFVLGGIISIMDHQTKSIITTIIAMLFGVSLMPFIYEKYLYRFNINKLHILLPIVLFIAIGIVMPKDNLENTSNEKNESSNVNDQVNSQSNENKTNQANQDNQNAKENSNNYKNLKSITDVKLKNNFIAACKQININVSEIKELKKVDDWNSGPRYTFEYKGEKFILYVYDSGEVSSITISNHNLDKIYLDGYEPYDVNNYLLRADQISKMQVAAESSIKSVLNHPDTAKFNWTSSGSYSRNNNIYIVSGKLEAQNSFGVKGESTFYIEEEIISGNYNVVYMKIDNKKYIGSDSIIKSQERKEIEIKSDNSAEAQSGEVIILKDGQKGAYGKENLFDGEKYIRYYIPAGKYEVEALTKNAQFYIEEISIHKEDGWDIATSIRKVTLAKYGDKDTIEIKSDQCISLVVHTQIKLVKK